MAGVARNTKKTVTRSRSKRSVTPMTKAEMLQKMLADQKIIREARKNGISYEALTRMYGFKFTTI